MRVCPDSYFFRVGPRETTFQEVGLEWFHVAMPAYVKLCTLMLRMHDVMGVQLSNDSIIHFKSNPHLAERSGRSSLFSVDSSTDSNGTVVDSVPQSLSILTVKTQLRTANHDLIPSLMNNYPQFFYIRGE